MKFRGRMTDQLSIRKFYSILNTMAKLSKICVMRVNKDKIFFILSENQEPPTVWSVIKFNSRNIDKVII